MSTVFILFELYESDYLCGVFVAPRIYGVYASRSDAQHDLDIAIIRHRDALVAHGTNAEVDTLLQIYANAVEFPFPYVERPGRGMINGYRIEEHVVAGAVR